ncbi:MAG: hypothetical protein M3Z66_19420 [Chloroflexota bacterium]|nr:hypothetical protein [Chloroflexota bacterium]
MTETNEQIGLTHEEAWEIFDEKAHAYLDMSAEEFVRQYDTGHLPDSPDVLYLLAVRDYAA